MTAGVELNFDLRAAQATWADEERKLYRRALERDEGAAALLLARHLSGGLYAPEVREAVEEGSREVMAFVLAGTTNFRRRTEVQPLMYFGAGLTRKRGEKGKDGGTATELVRARRIAGVRLSAQEVQEALTTQWEALQVADRGSPTRWPDRSSYPQTFGDAERRLIAYLRQRKYKSMDADEARFYVRDSLPNNPWDEPQTVIRYPRDW